MTQKENGWYHWWCVAGVFCIPFAIGALFHFVGEWAGWPALVVGGMYWVGCMLETVKKDKAPDDVEFQEALTTHNDARRWNALLNCARIRVIGSAGFNSEMPPDYRHMGIEIWTEHPAKTQGDAREQLCEFADVAWKLDRNNRGAEDRRG